MAEGNYTNPLPYDFKGTTTARFVKNRACRSELEIDEVEIYKDDN